jgi:hypothetical protein
MRCYELNDSGTVEDLRVEPESERILPHVPVAQNGEFCFALDDALTTFLERVPAIAPIRLDRAVFSQQGVLAVGKAGDVALVRLDVHAGEGGRVFLSAANERREWSVRNRVMKGYGSFPPVGITVVGPNELEPPIWVQGSDRIELALTMDPGSSFRIQRTGKRRGMPRTCFVTWSGSELRLSPPARSSGYPAPFLNDEFEPEARSEIRSARPVALLEMAN